MLLGKHTKFPVKKPFRDKILWFTYHSNFFLRCSIPGRKPKGSGVMLTLLVFQRDSGVDQRRFECFKTHGQERDDNHGQHRSSE